MKIHTKNTLLRKTYRYKSKRNISNQYCKLIPQETLKEKLNLSRQKQRKKNTTMEISETKLETN